MGKKKKQARRKRKTKERRILRITAKRVKLSPLTGCGGLWGYEMLRIPQ
jgi:hypothetical protein